jgi:putative hydrolase of the HAD superfamily
MIKINRKDRFTALPDAILLDMDNTLYPYEPAHQAGLGAVRDKAARLFSIKPEQFDQIFETARQEIKSLLGKTASSHSRLLYMQRMLEMTGLGSQVFMALDLEQTYWHTFMSRATLFDHVREWLDEVRLLGIPVGIVTDLTAQIQFRKIAWFNLENGFDCIVTSEEAGFDKPHSAPFQLALQKIQPNGANIWMVGDDPVSDIQGARQAIGATTLQKSHPGVVPGTKENAPDALFGDFSELIRLTARLSRARQT